jgi:hypothetical protein
MAKEGSAEATIRDIKHQTLLERRRLNLRTELYTV